jgi:hypothetical protein
MTGANYFVLLLSYSSFCYHNAADPISCDLAVASGRLR